MKELRHNTGVSVTVGPFVSHFSGVTEIINLTLASCPEAGIIKKSSGVSVDIRTNEWEHMSGGHYDLRLTASNTDTTGQLRVYFSKSTAFLQVWEDFAVVDQNFFDAKHSTGKLHTNPVEWSGVSVYSGGVSVINIGSGVTLSDKIGYNLASNQSAVTIGLLQRLGSGVTNPDKTGYSLGSDQSSVTIGLLQRLGSGVTNPDKTGYSISGTSTTLDALNDISDTSVSNQLVAILKTDAIIEPVATTPAYAQTPIGMLNHLYRRSRNKNERSGSTDFIYSEGGVTPLYTAQISDSGTTFTKGKYGRY